MYLLLTFNGLVHSFDLELGVMQVLQRIIMRAQDPDSKNQTLSTTEVSLLYSMILNLELLMHHQTLI